MRQQDWHLNEDAFGGVLDFKASGKVIDESLRADRGGEKRAYEETTESRIVVNDYDRKLNYNKVEKDIYILYGENKTDEWKKYKESI